MAKFELVQRLNAVPSGLPRNLGNLVASLDSIQISKALLEAGAGVELDYMGSSEFEVPKTLNGSVNRIARVAKELRVVTKRFFYPTFEGDVNFVCTGEQRIDTLPDWEDWAKNPKTLEPTGFFDSEEVMPGTVGWWAFHEDLIWTRDKKDAEKILSAFGAIAVEGAY